jgi:hypothetical protein
MENEMRKHIDSFKNFINENIDIKDFNISSENILKSFGDSKYVYSKTYDRIYQRVGNINYHEEPGDDGIPTILVDVDGGMYYCFKSLKAENVYEVLSTPKGFIYKDYSKKVGG